MAKKLNKYMNVDVLAFLEEKMRENTEHYQSDFEIDRAMIERLTQSQAKEDKTLLWLSRSMGTQCMREHDAFIRNTPAFSTWQYFANQESERIVAFAIELTDTDNGVVHGNLYELDYIAHAAELARKAVEPQCVRHVFEDGYVTDIALERSSFGYYVPLVDEHGAITETRYIPKDADELSYVLYEQKDTREKLKVADYIASDRGVDALLADAITRSKDTATNSSVKEVAAFGKE